jgi:hypothetical protein
VARAVEYRRVNLSGTSNRMGKRRRAAHMWPHTQEVAMSGGESESSRAVRTSSANAGDLLSVGVLASSDSGPEPMAGGRPGTSGDQAGDGTSTGGAWHALLLRMAGAVPDDLLTEARTWLADGQQVDVAQALTFAAVAGRIPVRTADAELIAEALAAAGQDIDAVAELELIEQDEILPSPWSFAPVRIDNAEAAFEVPPLLDLTADTGSLDLIDRAALDAAAIEPAVFALWRAWRVPADGSPWPRPCRVFVAAVPDSHQDEELPALTVRLQAALVAAGEPYPQVEVCADGRPVPAYQSTACVHAALLWAEEPAVEIKLARVFDAVDQMRGPMFHEDHPLIDDQDEVERLLTYLDHAVPVLTTSATMADVLDPESAQVVPTPSATTWSGMHWLRSKTCWLTCELVLSSRRRFRRWRCTGY